MAHYNEQKMALLKTTLQMPVIIRDLLVTNTEVAEDAVYGLHEMLGNYQPDEALLTCALSMKEIANYESLVSTDLAFLHMECDRIIERYVARHDLSEENPLMWSETQGEMMSVIAEDIESFLDLAGLCQMSFEITNPKLKTLLDIMTAQLGAQLMIVDEIIDMRESQKRRADTLEHPSVSGYMADNVIMFPQ